MRTIFVTAVLLIPSVRGEPVKSVDALVEAVAAGGRIEVAEGLFELKQPLRLGAGTQLVGAGRGKTVITAAAGWKADPKTLPDPETNHAKFDKSGYLLRLADKAEKVSVSSMTLTGPAMHGAIYGWANDAVEIRDLLIEDFMYAGIRTYKTSNARIHDCEFVDTGGRWERGAPGTKGGITGGGIFVIWISDSVIFNNRFRRTREGPEHNFYGIKGRQGKRLRIHHNTIEVNFSIEFPFENDEDIEIDHNVLSGTVSIPKHAGGPVPESGRTFRIHHNLFRDTYSIEFVRNGVEIDHNLFDFDVSKDHGNLISAFGKAPAAGPVRMHNNLIRNPGRGVIWMNEPYAGLEFVHNEVRCETTATPRTEGLFGFNSKSDFATYVIADNIIECRGTPRPLFRNDESAGSTVRNNRLTGITDEERYGNPQGDGSPGLEAPLAFDCGVDGETRVEGWKVKERE
ncbi:hypothetical protein HAHE_16770 [Haloferula helveola]|uniref:Right handed beta helix domain-containing protein n=1 Tax=Haloferula helveola TaxID=490095 RepID=A0ABM7RBI8_9BACT|nr:hypothetical protein HAHE_16770 [Haloferula helveola]